MASPSIRPHMLVADEQGNIYDHPDFLLLCRRGEEWSLPRPDELMPLPEESELFLLPGRRAVGLNPETGETEVMEDWAVAAFAAPAHTLTAHPVYMTDEGAPMLPLFAYGAVGFANGRFYVCAKKVDEDVRQGFKGISRGKIDRSARKIIEDFPDNRLMQHIMQNCTLRYGGHIRPGGEEPEPWPLRSAAAHVPDLQRPMHRMHFTAGGRLQNLRYPPVSADLHAHARGSGGDHAVPCGPRD